MEVSINLKTKEVKINNKVVKVKNNDGSINKIFVKTIKNMNAKVLNKINSITGMTKEQIIKSMNKSKYIYDDNKGKFYNMKNYVKKGDVKNKVVNENVILKKKPSNYSRVIKQLETNIKKLKDGKKNTLIIGKNITQNDFINNISKLTPKADEYYIITAGKANYTINANNIKRFTKIFSKGGTYKGSDSDFIETQRTDNFNEYVITKRIRGQKSKFDFGAYFDYNNNTNIDLSKYQIFNEIKPNKTILINEEYKTENTELKRYINKQDLNCFIYSVFISNIDIKNKWEIMGLIGNNAGIHKNKLDEIFKKVNIGCKLTSFSNGQDRIKIYGNKNNIEIELGLIRNHYFLNEDVNISMSYIRNLEELQNNDYIKTSDKVIKEGDKFIIKDRKQTMKSYKLIKYLLDNNYLKPNDKIREINIKTNSTDIKDKNNNYDIENTNITNRGVEIKDSYTLELNKNFKSYKDDLNYLHKNFKDNIIDEIDNKNNTKKIRFKRNINIYHNIYFDYETYTNKKDEITPFIVSWVDEDTKQMITNKNVFVNQDVEQLTRDFINSLPKGKRFIRLIAHNINFDLRFIWKQIYNKNSLIKVGRNIKGLKGTIYINNEQVNIEIKDSLALIPEKLSNFGKMFNLETIKEILPYKYYNSEGGPFNNQFCKLSKWEEYILKEGFTKQQFEESKNTMIKFDCIKSKNGRRIKNVELINDDSIIDTIKYNYNYCFNDCVVLRNGYIKFREDLLRINPNLTVDNVLTIASYSHQTFIDKNVYKNCKYLEGIPLLFIEKSIKGGRCMLFDNTPIKFISKDINNSYSQIKDFIVDFDAVSLYPSAMYRLGKELGGHIKGRPYLIKPNNLNMEFLNNQTSYFIDIKIKEVNKVLKMPLLSIMKDDVRHYTNDMIGEIITVSKIELEDLIKFQKIEFDIIKGYYYNKGRDGTITTIIEEFFNKRLEYKKQGNPLQLCYKLIMNSSYGKTGQKANDISNKIIHTEKLNEFVEYNFNKIKSYEKVNDKEILVSLYNDILKHKNLAHINSEILAMSKRIMNEVICLAENLKIVVYYTDTDSIHLKNEDLKILEKEYYKLYNKVLTGYNMEQFHTDFDLPKSKGEIKSTKFIGIGKKCYYDSLEGSDEKDNKLNGEHTRLKGVPNSNIIFNVESTNKKSVEELYNNFIIGKTEIFDSVENGNKFKIKFNKDMTLSNITNEYKQICFNHDYYFINPEYDNSVKTYI